MKKIFALVLAICVFSTFFCSYTFAEDEPSVDVYVNGEMIVSDVDALIIDGRTMLPVRAICNMIGAKVTWDADSQSITIENGSFKSVLTIDKAEAVNYNGETQKTVTLDAPPQIISGRTMVPVRFVSESMGADVVWDDETRSVSVNIEINPTLNIGKTEIKINSDANKLAKPDRIDISLRGLEWYVYNSDYSNYRMVAVKDGKVVGFFTNAKNFKTSFSINYLDAIQSDISPAGYSVKIYKDNLNGGTVSGILCIKNDAQGETDMKSDEFLRTQENEQFDMINAFRAANGKKALALDKYAVLAAQAHSSDMAKNNYLDHTGKDGLDVSERYGKLNKKQWKTIGENIEGGHMYACEGFFDLLNSQGHRNNMLSSLFKYVGIGMAYADNSDYGYYLVQVFTAY